MWFVLQLRLLSRLHMGSDERYGVSNSQRRLPVLQWTEDLSLGRCDVCHEGFGLTPDRSCEASLAQLCTRKSHADQDMLTFSFVAAANKPRLKSLSIQYQCKGYSLGLRSLRRRSAMQPSSLLVGRRTGAATAMFELASFGTVQGLRDRLQTLHRGWSPGG